jgi:hypothetical protein
MYSWYDVPDLAKKRGLECVFSLQVEDYEGPGWHVFQDKGGKIFIFEYFFGTSEACDITGESDHTALDTINEILNKMPTLHEWWAKTDNDLDTIPHWEAAEQKVKKFLQDNFYI